MASHLLSFATEAGIGLRAVRAQLQELCDKLSAETGPLTDSFREANRNTAIVDEIVRVVEQRIRKARTLIA